MELKTNFAKIALLAAVLLCANVNAMSDEGYQFYLSANYRPRPISDIETGKCQLLICNNSKYLLHLSIAMDEKYQLLTMKKNKQRLFHNVTLWRTLNRGQTLTIYKVHLKYQHTKILKVEPFPNEKLEAYMSIEEEQNGRMMVSLMYDQCSTVDFINKYFKKL